MELESPLKELYGRDRLSILEAQRAAQVIAFGPISFQASRMMWKLGIFQALSDNPDGINLKQIAEITKLQNIPTPPKVGIGLECIFLLEFGLSKKSKYGAKFLIK